MCTKKMIGWIIFNLVIIAVFALIGLLAVNFSEDHKLLRIPIYIFCAISIIYHENIAKMIVARIKTKEKSN